MLSHGNPYRLDKAVLFACMVVFSVGQTILFALMGLAGREIGLREVEVGAVVASSAVVMTFMAPWWGRRVDLWGRKRLVVGGMLGYGVGTLLFASALWVGMNGWVVGAMAFWTLIGTRVVYAMMIGSLHPAAGAYMANITSRADRSAGMALLGAGFALGSILGPGLAAVAVVLGLLAPLAIAAGMAVVCAIAAALVLRDHKPAHDAAASQGSVSWRAMAPYLAQAFLVWTSISCIQQTASFFVQDKFAPSATEAATLTGFAFMALALATIAMQMGVVQRLKPSPRAMLGFGFPVALAGVLLFALTPSYPLMIAAFALMGAGYAFVHPGASAAVSLSVGPQAQGLASGRMGGASSAGYIAGPLSGTAIYALSPYAPAMLSAACTLAAAAIFVLVIRPRLRR